MGETKVSFLNKILATVDKIQNNIYVKAVTQGMMNAMPVLMASAIFQLFYAFPIPAWTSFLQNIGVYDLLTTVVNICNLTAIFVCFSIAKTLGEAKGVDGSLCGIAALLCFLILTPITSTEAGDAFAFNYLGAQGIFTAMIVGIIAPSLYSFCIAKNIVIKLPDSVPPFVSKSLAAIPASLITVVPFVVLRGIFNATSYGSVTQFIYAAIQTPLVGLGNSLPAHLICIALCCFLWWCGVHGTLVILSVMSAMWTPAMIENLNAYNAGLPLPYVLSLMTFFLICQFTGGPGCLFGFYIDLAFTTKSERYKALGKLTLVPGMFNIIEPSVFGVPIVLNPVLLVPFVGMPVLAYLAYYILATMGVIGIPAVMAQVMIIPGPIAGFLLGGGVSLGIFLLCILALSVVVYYPFVKYLDNKALKEEQAALEQSNA